MPKLSALPSAAALDGSETFPANQGADTVKATAGQIAALAASLAGGTTIVNNQTGTNYTLTLADAGADVECTNAAAITVTIPANADVVFPVGTQIAIAQGGAGAVTIAGASGVTVNGAFGLATTAQYDCRVVMQMATDVWRVL